MRFSVLSIAGTGTGLLFLMFMVTIATALTSCGDQHAKADLVIYNATIYTLNEEQPTASAVVATDGKIVYIGNDETAKKYIGKATQPIDLGGRLVTPGWIESHGHFMGMGNFKMNLDLTGINNYDEMVQMVAEAAKKASPGEWITGRGWHQSKWDVQPDTIIDGFPTHHRLSAASPNNPVYLRHASGHAGFANNKAMEMAGVQPLSLESNNPTEVEGGEIMRDELGNPTGIFNERAMTLITQHIPESTPERDARALELAIEEAVSNGVTAFHDAGTGNKDINLYKQAIDEGKMKVRMYVMLSGRDRPLLDEWYEKGPLVGYGNGYLTVRSIKMYMDGALGSRGAWLLEEYTDMPGHFGMATMPLEEVYKTSAEALSHGFQVCSHAIGDRTNREVLDNYEKAFHEKPELNDHRFRIEHAQHLNPNDIPRFSELGVIASMQAIHMASDRPWAINRLGKLRILQGAYVWQKLMQSGAVVINGSDVPVEPIDPIASFYASVTRRTLKGLPKGGYEPDQRMTRLQALRSYTLDAAYAAFEEDTRGSIVVGKYADFTVFSKDLMAIPDDELLTTQVDYTVVNGKVVFQRN